MVISHDRYLIERIADSTYALFGDGKLTNLPGGIQQYLDRRTAQQSNAGVLDLGEARGAEQHAVDKQKALSSQEERELRKRMNALERKLEKADKDAAALEAEITELSGGAAPDFEAIGAKTKELAALRDERDELEMQWLELGEQIEA